MFCWWCHAILLVVQHGVPGGLRRGKRRNMQCASGIVAGDLSTEAGFKNTNWSSNWCQEQKQNLHFASLQTCPILYLPLKSISASYRGGLLPSVVQKPELQECSSDCSPPSTAKACSGWHCTFGPEQPGGQAGRIDGLAWQECMSATRGRCTAPTQTCKQKSLVLCFRLHCKQIAAIFIHRVNTCFGFT